MQDMSRPEPGAGSAARRGFPDAIQKKILIIYGAIFGAGLLYAFLILHTPFRIPCLFREVTGLQCPGCGTSRMVLALMRLDIPAGTAVRFEPGETKEVILTEIGGTREGYGLSGLVNGAMDDEKVKEAAFEKARELGFKEM